MSKVCVSAEEAIAEIHDGASIMVGGFGLCGNAEALIEAVRARAPKDLTLISNNAGTLGKGLATWLQEGLVSRIFCTYVGTNQDLHKKMAEGSIEVTVMPQGTFVERMRAAGAGIPAFYTPTGFGTVVAEGKETRDFEGRGHVLEHALSADFALIRADRCDRFGNVRFFRTARNFSPIMATAAKTTIVECDHLLELGEIDPDDVHLPGAFVQKILHVPEHEDFIEYRTVRKAEEARP